MYILIGLGVLFFLVDTWLFTKGYNTFIWAYRTPNELEAQRKILGIDE